MEKPKTLAAKLCEIMAECKNIPKNGKNAFHNYKYVKAADAADYIRDAMVRHGVIALPCVTKSTLTPFKTRKGEDNFLSEIEVKYTFINAENPAEMYEVSVLGSGSDASDKAQYKAMTGAHKYFLMQSFTLGGDDDAEKDEKPQRQVVQPKPAPKQQARGAFQEHSGDHVVSGGEYDGKLWKDLPGDWLEKARHTVKNELLRRKIEAEISRRDEEAYEKEIGLA